jgi:hypothetical protein
MPDLEANVMFSTLESTYRERDLKTARDCPQNNTGTEPHNISKGL